ncbi:MAG TPA: D-alanyl-D-alanine carboxypeptidase [Ruminiclostridium sp.]|uniref:serine-type D-Ala-D-Ala carboxypeptidase n=1 Tax=Acetivibrio saccincola TaxID=1677857 RepID=A0A2S8RBK9_9FIRM|nr:D-alanyl-D-alanine carboxypeptidase family protein [Acetivibrio saccincola]PQQ67180.1 D-alanyl-D-alanine carboxypeptidase [Acetivibrio saccincola]HAA43344.1 D-alanyl-D-alanine carboxypeptidase [Ruminiclostridium sp.]HQD27877.1 D-alanyl-D-alanine carboxypeptidase family protein [Acetivibrio saccincola]
MKKILFIILVLSVAISTVLPINSQPLNIPARAYILMDFKTGQVLYEYNSKTPLHPASTTKIMTGILAIEYGDLDSMVTVSQSAIDNIGAGGMHIGLIAGERLKLIHILNALLIRSANETAYVIAENISSSHEEFFDLMNKRAKELGAECTNFVNPSGMDNTADGHLHVSSAYDLALMARHAMTLPEFREIVKKTYYRIPPTNKHDEEIFLNTSNKLLFSKSEYYTEVTGIKTGYTDRALANLVSSARDESGMELIAAVMGVERYNDVFTYSQELLEYGFKNFSLRHVLAKNSYAETVHVSNASGNSNLDLLVAEDFECVLPKGTSINELTFEKNINENITAPVYKGDVLGSIEIKNGQKSLGKVDLIATRTVEEKIPEKPVEKKPGTSTKKSLLKRILNGTIFFLIAFILLRITLKKISRSIIAKNKF